ncbi:unnamed protein product [Durusdinium trenchii]|uniref:AP complex subunit sigma n=2 Tax=Durusdinium trenchii TaxID=1381693 RepID=A0ABP0MH84_9DINO
MACPIANMCGCRLWLKPEGCRMIRFILLQNRQGKTRLSKWYVPFNASEKFKIESEIHRAVVTRDPRNTNFLEYRSYKIIYRRYAGMFFIFCVDMNDNELGILELIHLFVEVLDGYFGNVCELDLVFHFDKVYRILDELLLAGEVSETSTSKIIAIMKSVDKMD